METENNQTLTKLILNNKIVQMRKNARRSRVHCISKLCREIKKLEGKKGTDEQKKKNTRKAERFVEQISFMKKIPDDEISKFALTNEKPFLEILNSENESSRNKALARLISNKCISEEVEKFREAYRDWKTSLKPLLSTLGEKYKNKKPDRNSIQSKKRKSSNAILEKTPGLTVKREKDESSRQRSKSVSLRNSSGTWSVNNMEQDSVQNVTSVMHQENVKKLEKEKHDEERSVKERPLPLPVVDTKKTAIPRNKSQPDDTEMSDSAVDPFFVTKDNKEYRSVSMKETQQNRLDNDVEEIIRDRSDCVAKRSKAKRKEFPVRDRQKKDNFKCSNTREESFTLHPSWAAKKNPLNSGILQPEQFVGKKIKFDVYDD